MPEIAQLRGHIGGIVAQVRDSSAPWKRTETTALRCRTKMAERDRQMDTWYLERRDVDTRARFASRCEKWSMIWVVFGVINTSATELDESMAEMFGGREAPGLINNSAF